MTEPLAHIRRGALPWHDESQQTECGRDVSEMAKVVSRDEAVAMWKKLGAQRASLFLCMTCISTANRHRQWDQSPIEALERWLLGGETWRHERTEQGERVTQELRAIAMLIDAHKEEFESLLNDLRATPSLDQARKQRRRREA